jgi:hypothetical protein
MATYDDFWTEFVNNLYTHKIAGHTGTLDGKTEELKLAFANTDTDYMLFIEGFFYLFALINHNIEMYKDRTSKYKSTADTAFLDVLLSNDAGFSPVAFMQRLYNFQTRVTYLFNKVYIGGDSTTLTPFTNLLRACLSGVHLGSIPNVFNYNYVNTRYDSHSYDIQQFRSRLHSSVKRSCDYREAAILPLVEAHLTRGYEIPGGKVDAVVHYNFSVFYRLSANDFPKVDLAQHFNPGAGSAHVITPDNMYTGSQAYLYILEKMVTIAQPALLTAFLNEYFDNTGSKNTKTDEFLQQQIPVQNYDLLNAYVLSDSVYIFLTKKYGYDPTSPVPDLGETYLINNLSNMFIHMHGTAAPPHSDPAEKEWNGFKDMKTKIDKRILTTSDVLYINFHLLNLYFRLDNQPNPYLKGMLYQTMQALNPYIYGYEFVFLSIVIILMHNIQTLFNKLNRGTAVDLATTSQRQLQRLYTPKHRDISIARQDQHHIRYYIMYLLYISKISELVYPDPSDALIPDTFTTAGGADVCLFTLIDKFVVLCIGADKYAKYRQKIEDALPRSALLESQNLIYDMLDIGTGLFIASSTVQQQSLVHLRSYDIYLQPSVDDLYIHSVLHLSNILLEVFPDKAQSLYITNPVSPLLEMLNNAIDFCCYENISIREPSFLLSSVLFALCLYFIIEKLNITNAVSHTGAVDPNTLFKTNHILDSMDGPLHNMIYRLLLQLFNVVRTYKEIDGLATGGGEYEIGLITTPKNVNTNYLKNKAGAASGLKEAINQSLALGADPNFPRIYDYFINIKLVKRLITYGVVIPDDVTRTITFTHTVRKTLRYASSSVADFVVKMYDSCLTERTFTLPTVSGTAMTMLAMPAGVSAPVVPPPPPPPVSTGPTPVVSTGP